MISSSEEDEYTVFMKDLMAKEKTDARDTIEHKAKRKEYHDFESYHAFPKTLLIKDLTEAGYAEMAKKAVMGDYDF